MSDVKACDHVSVFLPDLIKLSAWGDAWRLRRSWVSHDAHGGYLNLQLRHGADGEDQVFQYEWKALAHRLGMLGEPIHVWLEEGVEYLHVVTEWIGNPRQAPPPFMLYAPASPTESRSADLRSFARA